MHTYMHKHITDGPKTFHSVVYSDVYSAETFFTGPVNWLRYSQHAPIIMSA